MLMTVAAALHQVMFPPGDSVQRNRSGTATASYLSEWLLEVTQGPCRGAQMELALRTHLLKTISRALRAQPQADQVVEEENELKGNLLCVLQALIEGNDGEDGSQVC